MWVIFCAKMQAMYLIDEIDRDFRNTHGRVGTDLVREGGPSVRSKTIGKCAWIANPPKLHVKAVATQERVGPGMPFNARNTTGPSLSTSMLKLRVAVPSCLCCCIMPHGQRRDRSWFRAQHRGSQGHTRDTTFRPFGSLIHHVLLLW